MVENYGIKLTMRNHKVILLPGQGRHLTGSMQRKGYLKIHIQHSHINYLKCLLGDKNNLMFPLNMLIGKHFFFILASDYIIHTKSLCCCYSGGKLKL